MTPETLPPADRQQDGSALQVVLRSQFLLFHGQTCAERAVVLRWLRQVKAQSARDGEAERRKLCGRRN